MHINKHTKSRAGLQGRFKLFVHDVRGLRGTGPDGNVQFSDLWVLRNGEYAPRDSSRIMHKEETKNKVTRRGLSRVLHEALIGHPGDVYVPAEIVASAVTNPFGAFFFAADEPATIGASDVRPTFDESDTAEDAKVPVNPAAAGEGGRAVLVTDSTGPDLQVTSTTYPTDDPYREIKYVIYAQPNTPTYAAGSLTAVAKASILDTETFSLDDGANGLQVFEFDVNGTGVTAGRTRVDISDVTTDVEVHDQIIEAINAENESLNLTASDGGGAVVTITHNVGGAIGNVTNWVEAVTNVGFTITQPTGGGGALETGSGEVDNLPMKSVGMASGLECGYQEVDNLIGVRAILGLAPTIEGVSDRLYEHEGTGLHQYASGEDVQAQGAGYVQSGNAEITVRSITTSSSDSIDGASKTVIMKNGGFVQADVGRSLDIAGSGAGNDGRKTIVTVTNGITVVVGETMTSETDGFTADIIEPGTGDKCFDGDVAAHAATGIVDMGFHWKSQAATPYMVGRIWTAAQDIVGARIVGVAGELLANYPDDFTFQYLDIDKANTPGDLSTLEPDDDAHWTTIETKTTQAVLIYDGAEEGVEYLFASPPPTTKCYGIRLNALTSHGGGVIECKIGELYLFRAETAGNLSLTSSVDDDLKVATDGTPSGGSPGAVGSFTTFTLGAVAATGVVASNDVDLLVTAINTQVRGFELEALRSYLGFLWLRATVAGDNVQLDVDNVNNGSTGTVQLGFAALATEQVQTVGETQVITKQPLQALTAFYTINLSGDLPTP